jgi:hypothetical protein
VSESERERVSIHIYLYRDLAAAQEGEITAQAKLTKLRECAHEQRMRYRLLSAWGGEGRQRRGSGAWKVREEADREREEARERERERARERERGRARERERARARARSMDSRSAATNSDRSLQQPRTPTGASRDTVWELEKFRL